MMDACARVLESRFSHQPTTHIRSAARELPSKCLRRGPGWGRLFTEVRISGKDPAAVAPWTNRVLTEPAPQRRPANGGHNSLLDDLALNFRETKTGQGEAVTMRKFTGQCFDLDGDAGGKNGLAARPGTVPPIRGGVPQRNASAIC
jgi:hypothetical protein